MESAKVPPFMSACGFPLNSVALRMCVLCCGVGCCWVVWYGVVVCVCVSESAWVWVCVFVCGVRAFKWLKNMLLVESAREKRRRKRSAMTRRLCCFCVSHAVAVLALKNINLVESAIKAAIKMVQEEDQLASAPPPVPMPQTRCLLCVRARVRARVSPAHPRPRPRAAHPRKLGGV